MSTKPRRSRFREAIEAFERNRHRPMEQIAAIQLWRDLELGSWTVVEQVDRDRRRFLLARENTPGVRDERAITARERQVVEYAALGHTNKMIAYELGIAVSTVSTHLSNAAGKLGLHSRAAVIHTYAALTARSPDVSVSYRDDTGERFAVVSLPIEARLPSTLSAAEREVVALVLAGKPNAVIARERQVSTRTVANQIASVIKKLGVGSRAGIIAQLMRS